MKSKSKSEQDVNKLLKDLIAGDISKARYIIRLHEKNPGKLFLKFASACSYMAINKPELALSLFKECFNSGHNEKLAILKNILICSAMLNDFSKFREYWELIDNKTTISKSNKLDLLKNSLRSLSCSKDLILLEYIFSILNNYNITESQIISFKIIEIEKKINLCDKQYLQEKLNSISMELIVDVDTLLDYGSVCIALSAHGKIPDLIIKLMAMTRTKIQTIRLFTLCLNSKQFGAAEEIFENDIGIESQNGNEFLYDYINIKIHLNNWNELQHLINRYYNGVVTGAIVPKGLFRHLSMTGLSDSHHLVLANKMNSYFEFDPNIQIMDKYDMSTNHSKILKIGFMSSDFRTHAVSQLLVGVLEKFDRNKFNLVAYDLSINDENSLLRRRILNTFRNVRHVRGISDLELVNLIRADELDILVDLNGDTTDSRYAILRYRVAPIQVGWLGFPGTLGMGINDYLIADSISIPESSFNDFSEKIVWMPNSYIPNDGTRVPLKKVDRASQNLPEDSIVYCCFNGQYKITAEIFEAWMNILKNVPNSVLWLRNENPEVKNVYLEKAVAKGVSPDRLIFAEITKTQMQHMSRLQCADIALDTRPYNSHTTCIDALWAEVPLVTLPGTTFASRVASSILAAVQVSELICNDLDEYINTASRLGNERGYLDLYKHRLRKMKEENLSIFDTGTFASNLMNIFFILKDHHDKHLLEHVTSISNFLEFDQCKSLENISDSQKYIDFETAEALLLKDQYVEAQKIFTRIQDFFYNNHKFNYLMAMSSYLNGDYDLGFKKIDLAITLNPELEEYKRVKKIMHDKIQNGVNEEVKNKLSLAQRYQSTGKINEAIRIYSEVIEIVGNHPQAIHFMGIAELQRGNIDLGIALIENSIKLQPYNEVFTENLKKAISFKNNKKTIMKDSNL